jgi:hypothetical protein
MQRRSRLARRTALRTRRQKWPDWLKDAIRERDGGMCQWPGCGRTANDPAHIVNRTHKASKWAVQNVVSLCRKHHREGETYAGRVLLLALMRMRHGYEYAFRDYMRYWPEACELLELGNYDELEVVRLWKQRHQ